MGLNGLVNAVLPILESIQGSCFWMNNHQMDPLIDEPFIRSGRTLNTGEYHFWKMLNQNHQTKRIVYLRHLSRQAWAQVAVNPVGHPKKPHYVVRQFGASTQFLIIHSGEKILQVDSPTYWSSCIEDIGQVFAIWIDLIIVRIEEGATIQKESS